jgi:hypothetical protein
LAAHIGYLLSTLPGGVNVTTTTGTVRPAPTTPAGATQVLQLTASGVNISVPVGSTGYPVVYDTSATPSTISGGNVTILAGDGGGDFNVAGNSTVAATGGANTVQASGTYVIATGGGNSVVHANGAGSVETGPGDNTVVVAATAGGDVVDSFGTDHIVVNSGAATINAFGAGTGILGGTSGSITAAVSANAVTISSAGTKLTATVSGNNSAIFGGSGTSYIDLTGSNATVSGGSGAETINASGGTASGGAAIFAGTGPLTFVGGAGTATIVGGTVSGSAAVTVGSGGLVYSAETDNFSTIRSGDGSGGTTIFGGTGSDLNFLTNNSLSGAATLSAGAGNETLNAGGSSTNNYFFAGSGAESISGGSGANNFVFYASKTLGTGAKDIITDFHGTDSLYLLGYASTGSASALLAAATVNGSGVTLALSDNTKITFSNLHSTTPLYGHILYG